MTHDTCLELNIPQPDSSIDLTPDQTESPRFGPLSRPLEVWGGVECTVNRVGDRFSDQVVQSGHDTRITDLDLFANLGICAIRYPVIWERTQPDASVPPDWSWPDERLNGLRKHGIRPIVGLVHHGGGPGHTSLLDPAFPEKLAGFAHAVAERYPWVEDYTPVNEPLTTARFSGLCGHWHPHLRDEGSFARILVNQCRAVALSMQAIREVNPQARLVQTEDIGKTFSTPRLSYQADFENERRWVTFDLLCGQLHPGRRMWSHLRAVGIPEADLEWFLDHPCPPDLVGFDYYITSERFLDHRVDRYPGVTPGSNGRHTYVDVEAIRVAAKEIVGPAKLLRETWDWFRIPIAVTEVHLNCTREEQVRWLLEVWSAANTLRSEGVDISAVTAWALLGAYDWNSLLTRSDGHYESGVFDLRGPAPRPTALARVIKELSAGRTPDHPTFSVPGWWRRPKRIIYAPLSLDSGYKVRKIASPAETPMRPILITGASTPLGGAFARLCDHRSLAHKAVSAQELDIANPAAVHTFLETVEPWAVINAAGHGRVDDVERDPELYFRENTTGPAVLAAECARRNIPLVSFSSDLVFDGSKPTRYLESDPLSPLNAYGRSKAQAEREVLSVHPGALVLRTSSFFGPWDDSNFLTRALAAVAAGQSFALANDTIMSPTYVPDLVHACLDLLIDGESGLWNLANPGEATPFALASVAANEAGLQAGLLEGRSSAGLGRVAARPRYSVLGSERGVLLQPLENALECFFRDCGNWWKEVPVRALPNLDTSPDATIDFGRKFRRVSDAA